MIIIIHGKPDISIYFPSYLPSDFIENNKKIEELIEKRKQARLNKNFLKSDEIREELKELKVNLVDQKDGTTTWHKTDNTNKSPSFRLDFLIKNKLNTINFVFISEDEIVSLFNEDEIETIFNNFPLATQFTLIHNGKNTYLVNDWNDVDKIMVVGGKWKKDD